MTGQQLWYFEPVLLQGHRKARAGYFTQLGILLKCPSANTPHMPLGEL